MDKHYVFPGYHDVFERGGRFFVRYDAGAHTTVIREDEISEADAMKACASLAGLNKVLEALQKRLIKRGVDPYRSNT